MFVIKKLSVVLSAVMVMGSANVFALDLSLADAITKISNESNDLKKADANVKRAEASLDAANANRWFKLDGSVSYMNMVNIENPSESIGVDLPPELGGLLLDTLGLHLDNIAIPDNIFMAGISLTQPIYTFGKIGNAVRGVKSALKMSNASRELTARSVRYAAADLYWTAKMTDEIVKLAQNDLNNARVARKSLTSAGRAHRANLLKIESDIASKEINVSDAKFNRDTAHRMLKIMAGIDLDEELVLTEDFPSEFSVMATKKLESTPEWEILGEQVNMYESLSRSQRANGYPTLAATASYNYMSMGTDIGHMFDEKGSQSAYWGLALQVPIFSGGLNRANATVDAMNAIAAREDLEKSKKLTTEEYNNAIKSYNHLRGNLSTLIKARDLAAKTYELSQNRFATGQTSAVELADVSAGLYQLDLALLNTKYKILMSAENVKKLGE
ncbi:MAG: TolC family protein [Alphaproteobacteria bacterium]|nr:TolC family protein [Alphaproteobacteria bacterium]